MALPIARLVDINDGSALYTVECEEFKIGRSEECHMRLKSRSVSQLHCVIKPPREKSGQLALLQDCGSLNGTFVNGGRVVGACVHVQAGDTVRFGYDSTTFRFLAVSVQEQQGLLPSNGLNSRQPAQSDPRSAPSPIVENGILQPAGKPTPPVGLHGFSDGSDQTEGASRLTRKEKVQQIGHHEAELLRLQRMLDAETQRRRKAEGLLERTKAELEQRVQAEADRVASAAMEGTPSRQDKAIAQAEKAEMERLRKELSRLQDRLGDQNDKEKVVAGSNGLPLPAYNDFRQMLEQARKELPSLDLSSHQHNDRQGQEPSHIKQEMPHDRLSPDLLSPTNPPTEAEVVPGTVPNMASAATSPIPQSDSPQLNAAPSVMADCATSPISALDPDSPKAVAPPPPDQDSNRASAPAAETSASASALRRALQEERQLNAELRKQNEMATKSSESLRKEMAKALTAGKGDDGDIENFLQELQEARVAMETELEEWRKQSDLASRAWAQQQDEISRRGATIESLQSALQRQASSFETEARNYDQRLADLNSRVAELAGAGDGEKQAAAEFLAAQIVEQEQAMRQQQEHLRGLEQRVADLQVERNLLEENFQAAGGNQLQELRNQVEEMKARCSMRRVMQLENALAAATSNRSSTAEESA